MNDTGKLGALPLRRSRCAAVRSRVAPLFLSACGALTFLGLLWKLVVRLRRRSMARAARYGTGGAVRRGRRGRRGAARAARARLADVVKVAVRHGALLGHFGRSVLHDVHAEVRLELLQPLVAEGVDLVGVGVGVGVGLGVRVGVGGGARVGVGVRVELGGQSEVRG